LVICLITLYFSRHSAPYVREHANKRGIAHYSIWGRHVTSAGSDRRISVSPRGETAQVAVVTHRYLSLSMNELDGLLLAQQLIRCWMKPCPANYGVPAGKQNPELKCEPIFGLRGNLRPGRAATRSRGASRSDRKETSCEVFPFRGIERAPGIQMCLQERIRAWQAEVDWKANRAAVNPNRLV
jgi:hypothetical protein